jgi:hypothetical protein
MLILVKDSVVKSKRETVRCRDATASSFVSKFRLQSLRTFPSIHRKSSQ